MKTVEEKLGVLSKIAAVLNGQNIIWAVGASLLLYLKGYVDDFNDIDLMVQEKDALCAKDMLTGLGLLQNVGGNKYQSNHFYVFMIDGVEVDIMGGFIVPYNGRKYECFLKKEDIREHIQVNGQSIPLDSVALWRGRYEAMGRLEKVRMIDGKSI